MADNTTDKPQTSPQNCRNCSSTKLGCTETPRAVFGATCVRYSSKRTQRTTFSNEPTKFECNKQTNVGSVFKTETNNNQQSVKYLFKINK